MERVDHLDETLTERDETPTASLLLCAGWTRVPSGPVPWWRDPASDDAYPEWRALEIARRDAAEVQEEAQRERGQA